MTREELAAVKAKIEQAGNIVARLEILKAAKAANLALAIKPLCDWNTAAVLLSQSEMMHVVGLGIDTLIAQLKQELADISVGAVPAERVVETIGGRTIHWPPEVKPPFCDSCGGDCRGHNWPLDPEPEPLIAGGNHP